MSQSNKKTIIYIAGDGHSGSTLLDIILGTQHNAFSCGELINLPENGIMKKEYCSCGKPVPTCEVWSGIIKKWEEQRTLNLDRYLHLQKKLTSNKKIFFAYQQLQNPKGEILDFVRDTSLLFQQIFSSTKSDIIIDSSKSPNRILVLKKLGYNIKVIHLTRRFGDVLNSNKKRLQKNLSAGIEQEVFPKKTSYIFSIWMLINFLVKFYSKNIKYHRVKYESFVHDPIKVISQLSKEIDPLYADMLQNRGPFYAKHLVAGNRIRMKDQIHITEKPMDTAYHRLNKSDQILSQIVDSFY